MNEILDKMILPQELKKALEGNKKITVPESRNEMLELALGGKDNDFYEVSYNVPGKGQTVEATVVRCKNGAVVNYTDTYIRRRDPDCMVIADDGKTDKQTFKNKFGTDFEPLRKMTFEWIQEQNLILMPFMAGGDEIGYPMLLVAPDNAGFFAGGLSDLQGFIPASKLQPGFQPKAIIYLAPIFRHTHFDGKQIVVHNRLNDIYEMFSYNLYPGPSAKKGVYGVLLKIGEEEGWVTVHGSTVIAEATNKNSIVIMHEGASGGGKSEMTEQLHKEINGKIVMGKNTVTSEKIYFDLKDLSKLRPVTDDMALCHPKLQNAKGKITVKDAENGWFLRTDHIKNYGTDPHLERMCTHPEDALIFLNYEAVPGSTCLLWDHILDAPGKPCPNPRVIMPRKLVPDIVDTPVEVDIRSFGVRTPPCTKEKPSYGIMGLFHVLPPALAWLWRLVSPRGHANPSVTDTEGMSSEGVGSYWPFATGRRVDQANLLLKQIVDAPDTMYILIPNQHIGAYKTGFMPQWITREYLARKGTSEFTFDNMKASKSSLLGYTLNSIEIDGLEIPDYMIEVDKQPEVGLAAYEAGANILSGFFKKQLAKFAVPELDKLGRQIIESCFCDDNAESYLKYIPFK